MRGLLVALLGCWWIFGAVATVVNIPGLGKVRGTTTNLGKSRRFLGIKYGKQPTGNRRFAPPEPYAPWNGTMDATSFGPDCMQDNVSSSSPGFQVPVSEDCLYLNIYTPSAMAKRSANGWPVLLWLFGGGFTEGGGNETRLNGSWVVDYLLPDLSLIHI